MTATFHTDPFPSDALPRSGASPLPSTAHPAAVARYIAARRELWAPHVRFDPSEPHDVTIWDDDAHEVALSSWLPGQTGLIHEHLGRPGALLVLQGQLLETTWAVATDGHEPGRRHAVSRPVKADEVRSFGAVHVHAIGNVGPDPAIALHVRSRL